MALAQKNFEEIITFTRTSEGGRFNSSGVYEMLTAGQQRLDYDPITKLAKGILIEESRTNLRAYSSDFHIGGWTQGGSSGPLSAAPYSAAGPRGPLTMTKLSRTEIGNRYLTGSAPAAAGTTATLSFYAKLGAAGNFVTVRIQSGYPSRIDAWFNLLTGVAAFAVAGDVTSGAVSMTDVGGGVWRCMATATSGVSSWTQVMATPHAVAGLQVDGASDQLSDVYIDAVQVEVGALPTSYIPTPATFTSRASTATYFDAAGVLQQSSINAARSNAYGYDSAGVLRPIGLLVEGAATNVLNRSNEFGSGTWAKLQGAEVISDDVDPVFGTCARVLLTADNTANGSRIEKGFNVTAGQAFNQSLYMRSDTPLTVRIGWSSIDSTLYKEATLTPQWLRIVSPTRTASVDGIFTVRVANKSGVQGTIFIAACQAEQGYVATSYIPTTDAQVTRAADVTSSVQVTRAADIPLVNTLSPWYNQSEGTVFAEFTPGQRVSGNRYIAAIDNGTLNNRIHIFDAGISGTAGSRLVTGGVNQNPGDISSAYLTGVTKKVAMAWAQGGSTISSVGGVLSTSSPVSAVPTVTTLRLGVDQVNAAHMNGHLRKFHYYPRRLTDAELQTLTA